MPVNGIVFDLDDTLYPELAFVRSAFRAVAAHLCDARVSDEQVFDWLWRRHESGPRGHVLDDVLAWCGLDPMRVTELVALYRAHTPTIRLFDDAVRAIKRCRGRRRMAVITDGPCHMQRNKALALRLEQDMHPIIMTDAWGVHYRKPHPRAFECIMELWNMPGEELVYVADNPSKDFVAPNQLGWTTVRVVRPDGVYRDVATAPGGEPQRVLHTLDDLFS